MTTTPTLTTSTKKTATSSLRHAHNTSHTVIRHPQVPCELDTVVGDHSPTRRGRDSHRESELERKKERKKVTKKKRLDCCCSHSFFSRLHEPKKNFFCSPDPRPRSEAMATAFASGVFCVVSVYALERERACRFVLRSENRKCKKETKIDAISRAGERKRN